MAKNEKKAAGKSEGADPSGGEDASKANNTWLYALGAVAAVAIAAGIFIWRDSTPSVAAGEKTDPDLSELETMC